MTDLVPRLPSTDAAAVRPLRVDDVVAAEQVAWNAIRNAGRRYGFDLGHRDENRVRFAQSRVRHLMATDPEGAFVAESDGEVVGVALALRRGSLWFLSLLAVADEHQASGIGRQLIDRALALGATCSAGMICASPDPKALRRYGRAGFALHACVEATGEPRRDRIPAGLGVREGEWERDRELVDDLIALQRGEPYDPRDLDWLAEHGRRVLVRDGGAPDDRAVAVLTNGQLTVLAGASEAAATRVLWGVLAETEGRVRLGYLHNRQQWAIDVALESGLPLTLTDALATRGDLLVPPSPYLPSGILG